MIIMVTNAKLTKNTHIVFSLMLIAFGVFVLINPLATTEVMVKIIGGLFLLYGVIKLVGYVTKDKYQLAFQFDLAMGIFAIIIGIILIVRYEKIIEVLPIVVGFLILMDGGLKIQTAIDSRRFGLKVWKAILVIAIITTIAGAVLIIAPVESIKLIMRLVAINIIVDGILNFWVVRNTMA